MNKDSQLTGCDGQMRKGRQNKKWIWLYSPSFTIITSTTNVIFSLEVSIRIEVRRLGLLLSL